MASPATKKRLSLISHEVKPKNKITNYFCRIPGPPPLPPPHRNSDPSEKTSVREEVQHGKVCPAVPTVPATENEKPAKIKTETEPVEAELEPCSDSDDSDVRQNARKSTSPLISTTPALYPTPPEEEAQDCRPRRSLRMRRKCSSVVASETNDSFKATPHSRLLTQPDLDLEKDLSPNSTSPSESSASTAKQNIETVIEKPLTPKKSKKPCEPVKVHYSCQHCSKIFEFLNQFVRHLRIHEDEADGVEKESSSVSQSQIIMNSIIRLEEIQNPKQNLEELGRLKKVSYVEPRPDFRVQTEFGGETDVSDVKPFMQYVDVDVPRCENTTRAPPPAWAPDFGVNDCNFYTNDHDNVNTEDFVAENQPIEDSESEMQSGILDPDPEPVQLVRCPHCKYHFSALGLNKHLKERLCLKIRTATAGAPTKPRSRIRPPSSTEYKCEYCHKIFRDAYNLRNHRRVHTGEKPYSCRFCSRPFATSVGQTEHEQLVHTRILPHSCSYCSRKFLRPSILKRHLRIHTGEKAFSCSYCSATFASRSGLKMHKFRMHNTDTPKSPHKPPNLSHRTSTAKPKQAKAEQTNPPQPPRRSSSSLYDCEFCDKSFANTGSLYRHRITHTGLKPVNLKPFACEYCPKRLLSKTSLKIHTRRHTGEKPYSCDRCGIKYRHSAALRKHKLAQQCNLSS